jgi:hypothetical protein
MNLARKEDNFKSLVSYSTPALGRKSYAKKIILQITNGTNWIFAMVT